MTPFGKEIKVFSFTDLSCSFFFSLAFVSNYLLYNAYPLFTWATAALTLTFSLILLATHLLLKTIRTGWFFYVILICLFFDLLYGFSNRPVWEYCPRPRWGSVSREFLAGTSGYFALIRTLTWFSAHMLHSALMNHLLAAALAVTVVLRFKKTIPVFLTKTFTLLFLTTLIRFTISPEPLFRTNRGAETVAMQQPPADVFIFFIDEHVGIEGIPPLKGTGEVWKKRLTDHYQQRGFTLFPKAYSNYFDTHNSIPSILNYQLFDHNTYMTRVKENGLLESLLQKGLRLNIYQSNVLDFCRPFGSRTAQCFQYRANSAGNIAHLPLSRFEKIVFLADSFVMAHKSELSTRIYTWARRQTNYPIRSQTGPVPVMEVFKQMARDVQTAPQGTLFFAHLMMPHYPYVYDADCGLKRLTDWEIRSSTGEGNTQADWENRYEAYAKQSLCLDRKLEDFFKILDTQQRYQNASIVIFSDHGSRITLTAPLANTVQTFAQEDWMAAFSAFAAVKKGPLLENSGLLNAPTYEKRIPLAVLMNTLFQFSPNESALEKQFSRVYLRNDWASNGFSDFELPEVTALQ